MSDALASLRSSAAIGTGRTDDTAALQSVVDSFARPGPTGVVEIPPGVYRLTRPLVYAGDYSYGLTIRGGGSAAGPSGTVLLYDGPAGEAVISLRGCTSTTVERLSINGNGKAKTGIAIGYGEAQRVGTSGVYLDQIYVEGAAGPGSSAVSVGYDADGIRSDLQCDRIVLTRCTFQGHGKTQYGLLTAAANCKNFAVRDCGFTQFQTAVKFGGSGFMLIDGFVGGGNTVADFEASTGNLEIGPGNSEFSARMLTGGTGANPGSVTISNFSWASDRVPNDQVLISYQGVLNLTGNHFWNDTRPDGTPKDAPLTAIPRVQLLETPGAMTSLSSTGNFYQRAQGQIPVVSWDGGPLRGSPVSSFGDFGGGAGQLVRLSGVLDYDDGRRWTRDGLFNGANREWTPDGLYPGGGIKSVGVGSLIFGPSEGFRFVGWSIDPKTGDRRQGWIVPPLKGKK